MQLDGSATPASTTYSNWHLTIPLPATQPHTQPHRSSPWRIPTTFPWTCHASPNCTHMTILLHKTSAYLLSHISPGHACRRSTFTLTLHILLFPLPLPPGPLPGVLVAPNKQTYQCSVRMEGSNTYLGTQLHAAWVGLPHTTHCTTTCPAGTQFCRPVTAGLPGLPLPLPLGTASTCHPLARTYLPFHTRAFPTLFASLPALPLDYTTPFP